MYGVKAVRRLRMKERVPEMAYPTLLIKLYSSVIHLQIMIYKEEMKLVYETIKYLEMIV